MVNCQGLGTNLPSLRQFSREKHLCIIFDECSSQQVLANELVFQAGVDPVTLGQSACNVHAYEIWLHAVPMILCSNDFQMVSSNNEAMTQAEEDWLTTNIIDGSLPAGETWNDIPNQECLYNVASDGDNTDSEDA